MEVGHAEPEETGAARKLPDRLRYVVVEGVIGVGKSTLARLLAERYRAHLVEEEFEENPFLTRFYQDPPRWAFQTQLAFLASRFRQQKQLAEQPPFHRATFSDYSLDKDRIFAHVNLKGDELRLYESLFGLMEPVTPVPDLVVYLRSTVERLMVNIARRGRPYEAGMDPEYLRALCEAYDEYFRTYGKSALLIVESTGLDFVEHVAERERLLDRIGQAPPGTSYYRPPAGAEQLAL